jgi:transposase
MFKNTVESCPIMHAASRASKRSEKPAKRRPTADRSCSGVVVETNAVTERDRRRPRDLNPNSRSNVAPRGSSHPQGREATMQHEHGSSSVVSVSSPVVVGIDVSKAKLDCYVDPLGKWIHVDNDERGIAQLIDQLRVLATTTPIQLVVLEATGRLHRRVAAELLAAGIPVALVNPQRAREYARSAGHLEKTDRVDARCLAEFGRGVRHRTLQQIPQKQVDLDDLISRRRGLIHMRVAERNRLHDQLPKLARRQGEKLLRLIDQQIEDLDKAIGQLVEGDDDWQRKSAIITSVPGVSDGTAHQLIADLPELGTLSRQRIAKLVGVAPLADDSGTRNGARHIKGGRQSVRNALYMAAFNAMRYCERFKQMAEQLRKRGKTYKLIVTACMRKLLVTLNQMVKTNTSYNASLNVLAS